MELKDIKKVLILGAGTMGQQIGFVCAMHEYNVTIYDISDDILKASMQRIEKLGASFFVPFGRITADQLKDIMGRITATSDPKAAAKDADIINESVDIPNNQMQLNADFLKQYVDRGELGAKTKKGFYSYPMPKYTQAGFLSGETKK